MKYIWPKKYFWQYKTNPSHFFDYSMRFILRPIMLWQANGKISHWWHWRRVEKRVFSNLLPVSLPADPHALPMKRYMRIGNGYIGLDAVRLSLGGWQSCYILTPPTSVTKWQFAFPDYEDKNYLLVCSLILEGPVRVLQGSDSYRAFGINMQNKRGIPLDIEGPIKRSDTRIPWPLI